MFDYDEKNRLAVQTWEVVSPTQARLGNDHDREEMSRMGRKPELKRMFDTVSAYGFSVSLGSSWQFTLLSAPLLIHLSGTAGAFWIFFPTCIGMFALILSMAEMASMIPSSGAQYHWVSEFAPSRIQKSLSFMVGWLSLLGWHCYMTLCAYSAAQQLGAFISLSSPAHKAQSWESTLLTIAVLILAVAFNTTILNRMPSFEGLVVILHIAGFAFVVTVLWITGPREGFHTTFTNFERGDDWSSMGADMLVLIHIPAGCLIGSSGSCYLAEELRDASKAAPRSMIASATSSYSKALIMLITIMFTTGGSRVPLPKDSNPYISVLLNATGMSSATYTITGFMALLLVFSTINAVTQASRMLFSFARDGGIPFSVHLSYVREKCGQPLHAVLATLMITSIISLASLSKASYNLITSLATSSLLAAYMITLLAFLWRRISGKPLPHARFTLGTFGLVVNLVALAWSLIAFTFLFFPIFPNPGAAYMNWAALVVGGTMVCASVFYLAYARHHYTPPVERVKRT